MAKTAVSQTKSGRRAKVQRDGEMVGQAGCSFPFCMQILQVVVAGQGVAAGAAEDFADVEINVVQPDDRAGAALQEVADEGVEQGRVEQGDAQPPFLSGADFELSFTAVSVAMQWGDGERFTAVYVMDGLGDGRVYLLQDVQEGGVGQVALRGGQRTALFSGQPYDKGVEVGGVGDCGLGH